MKHLFPSITARLRELNWRRIHSRMQAGSALALGVGLLLAAILLTGILDPFQSRVSDLLYRTGPPSGQVVLVLVDNAGLAEIGPWPWSRATYRELISAINQGHPSVIALDIVLPEPSPEDASFVKVIQSVPQFIQPVIGVDVTRISRSPNLIPHYDSAITPAPSLQTANSLLAHTTITKDPDGVVRRIPLQIQVGAQRYPSLGLAATLALDHQINPVSFTDNNWTVRGERLPVDAQGQIYLNFAAWNRSEVISGADVLRGRVDADRFRDKIVLIGAVQSAALESFETPVSQFQSPVYGVEIQADMIETILSNRSPVEQDRLTQITMILLMALLAGATVIHIRLLSAAALTMLYFVAYLGYAFSQFATGIIVQPLYPAVALVLTFVSTMIFRYFAQDRQRDLVRRLFHRHVAPEAVDEVLTVFDGGALALAGTRRKISLLYVDLHAFGALTDMLPAETVIETLNLYIAHCIRIVFQNSGCMVRQTGETLVAAWNLPLDQKDHARQAVLAALEIKGELSKLAAEQAPERRVPISFGISTGRVVAGYVGPRARSEYTIIGEAVAIAERLAANNERVILIDGPTQELIGTQFQTEEAKPMRLRGHPDLIPSWRILEPMELEALPEPDNLGSPI